MNEGKTDDRRSPARTSDRNGDVDFLSFCSVGEGPSLQVHSPLYATRRLGKWINAFLSFRLWLTILSHTCYSPQPLSPLAGINNRRLLGGRHLPLNQLLVILQLHLTPMFVIILDHR